MKEVKQTIRCPQGHFYDAGKYDVCPHCLRTGTVKPTELVQPADMPPKKIDPPAKSAAPAKSEDKTSSVPPAAVVMQDGPSEQIGGGSVMSSFGMSSRDDSMTVHYYQKTFGNEPVVGWLVCISGVHRGQDFRIKSGRNFIGRGGSMDVCLSGDVAVSRDNHAILTYDPKGNMFFVQPGEKSSELSYLNEKPLLEATAIKSGDKLTVGESELMFVPFCGKSFTWTKGKPGAEK